MVLKIGTVSITSKEKTMEFFLFISVLVGVACFHTQALKIAVGGMLIILTYKLGFTDFSFVRHMSHEWVVLTNLFGLLTGFTILADHFEKSGVPEVLPNHLPDSWWGGFVLLGIVFVMSAFLDNIAAAMIGGTMALVLYQHKVHIGFIVAIVAASNAGGSGSVIGDTTTTMMWIAGKAPFEVLHAYIAAVPAFLFFGYFAAKQQHAYQPIMKDNPVGAHIEWVRLVTVAVILASAVGVNVWFNTHNPEAMNHIPVMGIAVWMAILAMAVVTKPTWSILPNAAKGSVFLLSLVMCASMMPVEKLPVASWQTVFGLGFVSAVFDNIPLTALALKQGGYDWGALAFAVGFGGSMIWFGSSAGVAISNMFPEAKSVWVWIKNGWHVAVGYVIGFVILTATYGWHPT